MSLPSIGPVGPRPDGLDGPFWAGLAEGRLLLQRCAEGHWIWGPRWVCPVCHELQPGWAEVPLRGTVFSWTRTHQPFHPDVADHLPYTTVLVELPDAGNRRILGVLLEGEPAIGQAVEGVIEPGDPPLLRWRPRPD